MRQFLQSRVAHIAIVAIVCTCTCNLFAQTSQTIQTGTENFEAQHRSNTGSFLLSRNTVGTGFRSGFQTNFGNGTTFGEGGIQPVYYFKLPARPTGESVLSASFSVSEVVDTSSGGVTPTFNSDLYALGFDNTDPPAPTDTTAQSFFFLGADQTGAAGAGTGTTIQKLQDDFLVPADFIANTAPAGTSANHTTSAAGNTALATYIQALYDNPNFTPDHDYLILRINPDVTSYSTTTGSTQRYTLSDNELGTTTYPNAADLIPVVDVTFTPEPSALAAIGLIGLGLLRRQRRRVPDTNRSE